MSTNSSSSSSSSGAGNPNHPYSNVNGNYFQYYNVPPPPLFDYTRNGWHQERQDKSNKTQELVKTTPNTGNSDSDTAGSKTSDNRTTRNDPRSMYYNMTRQHYKYPQSYSTSTYDRRNAYSVSTNQYGSGSTDYSAVVNPFAHYGFTPPPFNAAYPPPLPPPPPPPPTTSHNHNANHSDNTSRNNSHTNRSYYGQQTVPRSLHGQNRTPHTNTGHNNYYLGKRRSPEDLEQYKGSAQKKRKKPLSQNVPSRKDWTDAEAEKALNIERACNTRHKSQSLIIKFPDLELNRDIVSNFHPLIDSVHFQQPSTPRFCFITLNSKADPQQVISDLSKVKFGNGYLVAEPKKDREDEMNISAKDIDPFSLYVGNLPQDITKEEITNKYPKLKRMDIGWAQKMRYTRYAFVSFHTVDDAIEAFKNTYATLIRSKSLIVRFRRLHGTVGMPGEPKQQNPAKRSLDGSNTTQTDSNYDENKDSSPNGRNSSMNAYSVEDNSSVDDSLSYSSARSTLFSPDLIKLEPESDDEDMSFSAIYPFGNNSLSSVVKPEIKDEQNDSFSDDDFDNKDEPLPPIFQNTELISPSNSENSASKEQIQNPNSSCVENEQISDTRVRHKPIMEMKSEKQNLLEDRHILHRPMLEPKIERDEIETDIIHRPILEPKVEPDLSKPLVTPKVEPGYYYPNGYDNFTMLPKPLIEPKVETPHLPMIEPKLEEKCNEEESSQFKDAHKSAIEPKQPVVGFNNDLMLLHKPMVEIKTESHQASEDSDIQSCGDSKIQHRPIMEKSDVKVKEENDDTGDSDSDEDNFSFNNLLEKIEKPKV